ncbi:MAG: hypothetical protein ABWY25_07015 [Paenisporosarcina sp.]|jgi:cold shock CspA family protein
MEGIIRKLKPENSYAFISTDKADYFMHKSDFDGHWEDLVEDVVDKRLEVKVEFEPKKTEKGLRAAEVRRLENG